MHDRELTPQELTTAKRTKMAWAWLLSFREGKALTDESVAEFLTALDKAVPSMWNDA